MMQGLGLRSLLVLGATVGWGCGGAPTSTPSAPASPTGGPPAAPTLPWPGDPGQAHPATSEAEAIALGRAYLKAHPPRPEDAGEYWQATAWNDGWAVATAATNPPSGGQQTNLFVDRSGRVVARRAGVNPTFSDGTEDHRHNQVTFPWPADAKDAHPPTNEAEAIALVRALGRATDPDSPDCWSSYSAMKFDDDWRVTITYYPPTPGHHSTITIDKTGRIVAARGGE